jgi:iron complex transport system substrate-binding protein
MTDQAQITNDKIGRFRAIWSLIGHWGLVVGACSVACSAGCDRHPAASATTAPASRKNPAIASLVPAATDLLIGMEAADHLVAVSNWDTNRPAIGHLPRVGDYQSTDWEKLAQVRPDVMIVFMSGQRMPAGIKQRADELHIRLVNVKTETVQDIFDTIQSLGELTGEPDKAADLSKRIRSQLDGVAARVAGKPRVPTLLARDEEGYALIAGNTFADDLLTIAGGKNVAADFPMRYPSVDRERLTELAPQAIIQLMPDASPQVILRATESWHNLSDLPAVKQQRVYIITDWYALQPGSHIGDLAEQMAKYLHPE